ncbi:helicase [Endomicrobiia bacterium]|nr:helicase [Endomicrobiia bacterium]
MTKRETQPEALQKAVEWREAIGTLPDSIFFDTLRMYLGEIKTPYNKQTLIAELEAFLLLPENQKNAALLLSDTDRQILAAVMYLPLCTFEALTAFFGKTMPYVELYEAIQNLEERLILFRKRDKMLFAVSPVFETLVRENAPVGVLLPPAKIAAKSSAAPAAVISPSILGAFLSFVVSHSDLCKINGEFKKRILQQLQSVFSAVWNEDTENMLMLLLQACVRLGFFRVKEDEYIPNFTAWTSFAALPHREKLAWFAAAAGDYYAFADARYYAGLLTDIVEAMPESGISSSVVYRIAMLNYRDNSGDSYAFQRIKYELSTVIGNAVLFGLLSHGGKTAEHEAVFLRYEPDASEEAADKALSIDAGFSVTVFPGLSFAKLVKLIPFLELVRYDTAAKYEITRKSCIRGFDSGLSPETILPMLEDFCSHAIPRNLPVSISDWYTTYRSVALYDGYVLCISEDRRAQFERNPAIASKIRKILAPGVYFCTFETDAEAAKLIEKSMSTIIGKTVRAEKAQIEFDAEYITREVRSGSENPAFKIAPPTSLTDGAATVLSQLTGTLKDLNLPSEQYEALLDRIQRRIILNPVQLRHASVKPEKLEAGGMDFLGKMHIIESAIAQRELLEFGAGQEGASSAKRIIGTPVWLAKRPNDSLVTVVVEPEKRSEQYAVGQLRYVRRIRTSIFKTKGGLK